MVILGKIYKVLSELYAMKLRVDLHCHGPNEWIGTSRWNAFAIAELVRDIDAVGIVEMSETDRRFDALKSGAFFNCHPDEKHSVAQVFDNAIYLLPKSVLLFRAQEIATVDKNGKPEGHVLIFGNRTKIKDASLDEVLDKANGQGAAVIADHPFAGPNPGIIGVCYANSEERILKYFLEGKIHAVEYNGCLASSGVLNSFFGLRRKNDRAVEFAREHSLNLVANTDSHSARELKTARAYTYFPFDGTIKPQDYVQHLVSCLKEPGNSEIEPLLNPAPAFSTDLHAAHIKYLQLTGRK